MLVARAVAMVQVAQYVKVLPSSSKRIIGEHGECPTDCRKYSARLPHVFSFLPALSEDVLGRRHADFRGSYHIGLLCFLGHGQPAMRKRPSSLFPDWVGKLFEMGMWSSDPG